MKTAIAGAVAVLTVLSINLPVLAATTTKYQFKGQNTYISFYQYDECNVKSVNIYAFANRTKEVSGAPTQQMGADIYYGNYNYCTGESSNGYGSSPNAKFTTNNQLSSATLTGTFAVYDSLTDGPKTVEVNLTLTGIGFTSKGRNNYTSQTPTSMTRYRSIGEYREAEAAGSVILDGINLIANTAGFGSLNSSTSGSYERIAK